MSVDLRTRYLGLELRSPIVASAAPHNADPAMARRLERAGVGAIVLPSLFEEEILAEEVGLTRSLEQGAEVFAEALDYFPAIQSFTGSGDRYLAALERVKASVTIPVIASLNASTRGRLGDVCATDPGRRRGRTRAQPVPRRGGSAAVRGRHGGADLDLIAAVRASITIPLAVKLSPFYSAFANFAAAATGRRAPMGSCCSTASTSRTSTSTRSRSCPRLELEPAVGDAAAGPLDRDPPTAARS